MSPEEAADAAEAEAERQAGRFEDRRAQLQVGRLSIPIGQPERRCGIHGEPTSSGCCSACDRQAGS